MAYQKKNSSEPVRRRAPAKDPETREKQLISAAVDLAEKQILEGTASATVIVHYLKASSMREKLERERLVNENRLLQEKVSELSSRKNDGEQLTRVLNALGAYQGTDDDDEDPFLP